MKITLKRKKTDESELLQKTIREQKARIEDLKRENTDLLYSLDEYTKKENSILESIGYLEEKKREQTESLNKKYAAELQKLQFFEEKWLNIVRNSNDPSLFAGISFTREALKKCREEILETTRNELRISKDLTAAEEDFASETLRLQQIRNAKQTLDDTPPSFSESEFSKYSEILKNAADNDRKPQQSAVPKESDDLADAFYKRFGIPLSSARQPKDALSAETSVCETQPQLAKEFSEKHSNKAYTQDYDAIRSDFEERYPMRDNTDSVPIKEPETQISPKKMSDKEIVSLLEKLSV